MSTVILLFSAVAWGLIGAEVWNRHIENI